jgi:hypothetical protein
VFSSERVALLRLCGLVVGGAAAAASAVPGSPVYSSRFALDRGPVPASAEPAAPAALVPRDVVHEVVVRWESDVRPAAPAAARVYMRWMAGGFLLASSTVSDGV